MYVENNGALDHSSYKLYYKLYYTLVLGTFVIVFLHVLCRNDSSSIN